MGVRDSTVRVAPSLLEADRARLVVLHERVKNGDFAALRGAWRWQQEAIERRKCG